MVADSIRKELENRKGAIFTMKLFKDLRTINKVMGWLNGHLVW